MNSNMIGFSSVTLVAALCFSLVACGSGDGDEESKGSGGAAAGTSSSSAGTTPGGTASTNGGAASTNGGAASTNGVTACGISNCSAGQYCNNGLCLNGCLTKANCGTDQGCEDIDSDSKVGTCKNKVTTPAKDCNAFCDKSFACMDPDFVQCMQVCTAASAACIACINDSNCGAGCDDVCMF
jgi:hypothetical protein